MNPFPDGLELRVSLAIGLWMFYSQHLSNPGREIVISLTQIHDLKLQPKEVEE